MYFMDPLSDWYSASVSVIIYVISYNIGPRYNGTRLYYERGPYFVVFCLGSLRKDFTNIRVHLKIYINEAYQSPVHIMVLIVKNTIQLILHLYVLYFNNKDKYQSNQYHWNIDFTRVYGTKSTWINTMHPVTYWNFLNVSVICLFFMILS